MNLRKFAIMKTLIISPTYNESKNISTVVETVFRRNPESHLLIVDDSSPDGTAEIVKNLQSNYPNLFLEIRKVKNGLGKAYLFGFKWALDSKYETILRALLQEHPLFTLLSSLSRFYL